jgi:hypothetical protein
VEERDEVGRNEQLQVPDEAVEDLEPSGEQAEDVAGGTYNWWKKTEG